MFFSQENLVIFMTLYILLFKMIVEAIHANDSEHPE